MHCDRYSPDVESRYRAALAEEGILLSVRMPFACFGVGNAFLALIGPSMGTAGVTEDARLGGSGRPESSPMRIGRYHHFAFTGARSVRWRRLSASMLGGEQYVDYLTTVLNLDWAHEPNEARVPKDYLKPGFDEHVWPAIKQIRPRIVGALTNRVWDIIYPRFEKLEVPFAECPISLPRPPVFFRLPDAEFTSMLLKRHNHPSQPFLGRKHIDILGKTCEWFRSQEA